MWHEVFRDVAKAVRASQGDHSPIGAIPPKAFEPLLKLFLLVDKKRAATWAACETRLKANCDAVGKHYPHDVLKDRAAPVSSRRVDARQLHRESVARPGRAVRRSAASARPRSRRMIASHAGEMRTLLLDPAYKIVIRYAPGINALAADVGAPAPRDETSARARTRSRFRGTAPTAPTPRMPAGPHRADLARLRSVPAVRL